MLGADALERVEDGLLLKGVWVDAISYETLAGEAMQRLEHGDPVEGLRLARRARGLYGGDLCADEAEVDMFVLERERFRLLHIDLHAAAAAAACDLGWARKAIRWARWTIEVDAGCERAYRVMMRAHALLGETERAQRAYDQCRRALAEEFGADPSPETEAAHLELLRLPQAAPRLPFVGRAEALAAVRAGLRSAREDGSGLAVIVSGAPGAGRTRFIQEVCAAANLPLERFDVASGGGKGLVASVTGMTKRAGPAALLVEELHTDPPCLLALRAAITRAGPGHVLLAAIPPLVGAGDAIRQLVDGLADSCLGVHVELGPLTPGQAAELATAALGGRPDPALLNHLFDVSGGLPGPLVDELARTRSSTVSAGGSQPLVTAQWEDDGTEAARLEQFRALLTPAQERVIQIASVVGEAFSHRHLDALAGMVNGELEQALDALEDYGLLLRSGERYRFASRILYDGVYEWVSPSARRRVHAAVAEWPDLDDDQRLDQLLRAGETRRACSTALVAARLALSQGRYRDARRLLISVLGLTGLAEITDAGRIELLEEFASACQATGSGPEARAALDEAIDLATRTTPGALPRLYRRRGDIELPASAATADAGDWYRRAQAVGGQPVAETIRTKLAIGSMMALRSPKAAEPVLTEALAMADEAGDTEAQVTARTRLAGMVLVPQRRLLAAREQAGQAVLLAEGMGRPALLATALLRRWEPELWLGSQPPVKPLRQAWRLAVDSGAGLLRCESGLMLCLALHDGGDPEFGDLWPQGLATAEAASWGACVAMGGRQGTDRAGHVLIRGGAGRALPQRLGGPAFLPARAPVRRGALSRPGGMDGRHPQAPDRRPRLRHDERHRARPGSRRAPRRAGGGWRAARRAAPSRRRPTPRGGRREPSRALGAAARPGPDARRSGRARQRR
ncbi:MAG: hypothetical protein GEU81_11505 [Nitriliruptorales bacterium]|nr:hypothetical protein [Nitriliruptorales bacterium]